MTATSDHPACPKCGYDVSGLASMVCPECGRPFTQEDLDRRRRRQSRRRRWLLSASVMFVVLYAPYMWLLLIDYSWSSYRWLWIKLWLGLPGMVPCHFLNADNTMQYIAMHVVSLFILVTFTAIGARGRWFLIVGVIVLGVAGTFNSIGLYHAFRM